MAKHTKLKTLLEGYAWERSESSFGKPLATLAEIQAAYQAKQSKLQEADGSMTISDFNDIFENFYQALEDNAAYMQPETLQILGTAIQVLQKAQKEEADAHGVSVTSRRVYLDTKHV